MIHPIDVLRPAGVVLLHESPDGSYVEGRRPRLRDVLAVWLHACELDRVLASGVSPDSSVPLALHARRLGLASTRSTLARRLAGVLHEVARPAALISAPLPVCRRKVALARPELLALADRLAAAGAVSVGGLARTRLLLRDGRSPLYSRPGADDLAVAAETALRSLDPWSPEPDEFAEWAF